MNIYRPYPISLLGKKKYILSWYILLNRVSQSFQFSSVAQSCLTLCDPMNRSTSGLPVHHQLPEFTQTHVHQVSDAIQPSHPLSSPSPPALKPSQHQSLFQWVNSSHEVAKVLEFQLYSFSNMVDPWITWVWTAQVHLHMNFYYPWLVEFKDMKIVMERLTK